VTTLCETTTIGVAGIEAGKTAARSSSALAPAFILDSMMGLWPQGLLADECDLSELSEEGSVCSWHEGSAPAAGAFVVEANDSARHDPPH
jgi:hypothetical protein